MCEIKISLMNLQSGAGKIAEINGKITFSVSVCIAKSHQSMAVYSVPAGPGKYRRFHSRQYDVHGQDYLQPSWAVNPSGKLKIHHFWFSEFYPGFLLQELRTSYARQ